MELALTLEIAIVLGIGITRKYPPARPLYKTTESSSHCGSRSDGPFNAETGAGRSGSNLGISRGRNTYVGSKRAEGSCCGSCRRTSRGHCAFRSGGHSICIRDMCVSGSRLAGKQRAALTKAGEWISLLPRSPYNLLLFLSFVIYMSTLRRLIPTLLTEENLSWC